MYLSSYKKMRGNDRIIQVNSERLNKSVEEEEKKRLQQQGRLGEIG